MSVNISATFKKDERPRNGLEAIAGKLVDDDLQHEEYVIVAIIRPKFFKVVAEDGERTPTIRLDHVEVMVDEAAAKTARELLKDRYKDRTGKDDTPPPDLFSSGGVRVVPPPSAEEIAAEARERREAEGESS
jgi:hypothetical protein